jgi:hypothetical protein
MYVTHLAGTDVEIEPHWSEWPSEDRVNKARELVARIRGRLDAEFQQLTDEDLMAAGVFVAARRRAG